MSRAIQHLETLRLKNDEHLQGYRCKADPSGLLLPPFPLGSLETCSGAAVEDLANQRFEVLLHLVTSG